uniref:Uncharacterized protein n=1 Tax=Arundo donax TaxID=35708 RepID=A0A0A9AVG6_ARUDO
MYESFVSPRLQEEDMLQTKVAFPRQQHYRCYRAQTYQIIVAIHSKVRKHLITAYKVVKH